MSSKSKKEQSWQHEISPDKKWFDFKISEIIKHKDLLFLLVKRDIITAYKQTILGPLWYLIQPLITSIIFTILFNKIANIPSGGIPPFLFNLTGITVWNYFSACLTGTSDTFKNSEHIFNKVYFPRIIMPLSTVISNLVKFGIQCCVLIFFYIYFILHGAGLAPNISLIFFPVLIIIMAMLGLGTGLLISSLVTKYRDLTFVVQFGIQLFMYMSAVVYPMSIVAEKLPNHAWMVEYNPMALIIEISRYMILNIGQFHVSWIVYIISITCVVLFSGFLIFNKSEKTFIDNI